ncbi:MAG TPA: hypothetical protein VLM90_01070 [Candidatus Deferrimicrobium sp.]|nr:hypothetical protein [Candidatus Deferrimicrobium sp.]
MAQIFAASLNFFARGADVLKILADFRVVEDSPIIDAPVASEVVASTVVTIEARVAPVTVTIMPPVAIMAFVSAMASLIMAFPAVKLVRLAMPAAVVVFSPLVALTAIIGISCRRQEWDQQSARKQPCYDNSHCFLHYDSPFILDNFNDSLTPSV